MTDKKIINKKWKEKIILKQMKRKFLFIFLEKICSLFQISLRFQNDDRDVLKFVLILRDS